MNEAAQEREGRASWGSNTDSREENVKREHPQGNRRGEPGNPGRKDTSRPRVLSFLSLPSFLALRSLQHQLVALIVISVVMVTAVIGAVSVIAQNHSLVSRLDEQLRISLDSAFGLFGPGNREMNTPGDNPGVPEDMPQNMNGTGMVGSGPGPRFGSLDLVVVGETVLSANLVDDEGVTYALSSEDIATLMNADVTRQSPRNITVGDQGSFRIMGQSESVGNTEGTVIVGQSLTEVKRTTRTLTLLFVLTGLVGVVVAAAVARLLVRVALSPVERLRATTSRITRTPLTSGAVSLPDRIPADSYREGTEVGDLSESFNQMLDHVEEALVERERSEARLKRFAADASHELRTPLATVSGYAELAQRRNAEVPEDVARSLDRIRSESGRMATLVEDLLLLARLDSGDRVVASRVDIARVILDCVSDARVTGPDHLWSLEIEEDAATLAMKGNAGQLHQMMANLLANARLHTPPGTQVIVRLGKSGTTHVLIEVEDTGPGIPPELQQRLFDRFTRGDEARAPLSTSHSETGSESGAARGTGGAALTTSPRTMHRSTGLGLAITSALVEAHGGKITVTSSPGRTVFSLCLPLL